MDDILYLPLPFTHGPSRVQRRVRVGVCVDGTEITGLSSDGSLSTKD